MSSNPYEYIEQKLLSGVPVSIPVKKLKKY